MKDNVQNEKDHKRRCKQESQRVGRREAATQSAHGVNRKESGYTL